MGGNFSKTNFRYLRLDCLILQRSMLHVIEGYYQLLGVNLIESFKLTISSLSSFGVQVEMFRKKRIGFFFCNNSRVYAVRRPSMTGGLSFFRPSQEPFRFSV